MVFHDYFMNDNELFLMRMISLEYGQMVVS
jgi:hypothetical protein